ncbi:MAG: hypothetical protein KJZ93_29925 [Caldilineaceae bacterium]|nr:hypothetical protein [Caldilineaceae bacterium]
MKTLPTHAFQSARAYLFRHGRPLDQTRFRFYFEDGNRSEVIAELEEFQNPDGGFGHALEPDLRTAASSAIATATGLAILRAVAAPPAEPIVQRAINYLIVTYDAERQRWPIVPPAVEEAPHAPWWTHAESEQNFGSSLINPTASITGYLYDYPTLSPADLLSSLTSALMARLAAAPDKMEMHDLQCWIAFAEATGLPGELRSQAQAKLRHAAPATIEQNPRQWTSYGLQPLDVASTPDSFLADVIAPSLVEANLDFVIDQQLPDGSWPIPWNWAFVDGQAWAQAEQDWKGVGIVQRLLALRAYGRLARA